MHHANIRAEFAGSDRFVEYDVDDPDAPKIVGAALGIDFTWWGQPGQDDEPALAKNAP